MKETWKEKVFEHEHEHAHENEHEHEHEQAHEHAHENENKYEHKQNGIKDTFLNAHVDEGLITGFMPSREGKTKWRTIVILTIGHSHLA